MSYFSSKSIPYIIAEAGVNHNGKLNEAFKLVDIAKESGADCVKFQAFSANELAIKSCEKPEYQKRSGTKEENQYDMLLKYELKENEFKEIKHYCQKINIDFLITPFSVRWVKEIYNMDVKMIKISSGSIDSFPLLEEIGKTKLPVILSTGMSNIIEIKNAVNILINNGSRDISLLHCVSLYPTSIELVNLFAMHVLKNIFGFPIGFSDHTQDINIGQLAVAAGAIILEKHFTIDRNLKGPDHLLSLCPSDLKRYIQLAKKASIICGKEKKEPLAEEFSIKRLVQTSLVSKRFIKKGEIIAKEMITDKRPATGIPPEKINTIMGRLVIQDIPEDEIIKYDYLEN